MFPARLLICGFGAFPAAPRNPAGAVVEALADRAWAPAGTEADYLVAPVAWDGSAEAIEARLASHPADGVLIVGVAVQSRVFRVERLARNRASTTSLDHAGARRGAGEVIPAAPGELAATAPVEAMRCAIEASELPVEMSDDAGDYLCNFTLYRILHGGLAPRVGFLHTPQASECVRGGAVTLAQVEAAVRAAAQAMASDLTPPIA